MKSLVSFFGCGALELDPRGPVVYFVTRKLIDITDNIIPFFTKYPITGVKLRDFVDFCKVVQIMQQDRHLTKYGLEEIRKIKSVMNTGR